MLAMSCIVTAEDAKIAVEIDATTDDQVGRRLVYQLKEALAASGRLRETFSNEPRLKLSIVTLDIDNAGTRTAYSAAWQWTHAEAIFPMFLTSSVGTCGSDRVVSCSQSLLAVAVEQADSILKIRAVIADSTSKKPEPKPKK